MTVMLLHRPRTLGEDHRWRSCTDRGCGTNTGAHGEGRRNGERFSAKYHVQRVGGM